MCGIFCMLCEESNSDDLLPELLLLQPGIQRRGPDFYSYEYFTTSGKAMLFAASVLWLQGKKMCKQPVITKKSILIYNGDIFGGKVEFNERINEGDTLLFLSELESNQNIFNSLDSIHGPYGFVYLNKCNLKLFFGRDIFGRRSLLLGKKNGNLIITSVAKRDTGYEFIELPSIGVFCLDLATRNFLVYPFKYQNKNFNVKLNTLSSFLNQNVQVISHNRIIPTPFQEPNQNDLSIFKKLHEINCFELILQNEQYLRTIQSLKDLLENAVNTRINSQPNYCKNCIFTDTPCNHATIGILFSGGIDCSILALLADKFIEKQRPIDLINVSFDETHQFMSPDRQTGLNTLKELQVLVPDRKWCFLEINVTKEEVDQHRQCCIADLIYPLNTILDDSLGCALWFAARGKTPGHKSSCRVLLAGMGADELFGGYTRHKAAFSKRSWKGVHDELDIDWQNISHRNLGRDDRVVSDSGRQLRMPFLDEYLVNFVRNLPCWQKTYPSNEVPGGIGEKILLRCLGYYLGLKKASQFKKRALQFGSRIANPKENANDISCRLLKHI